MTDADWWARVVQGRESDAETRVGTQGTRVAIDVMAVPGIRVEIMLMVDGERRWSRLFRSHEQAELVSAIVSRVHD